MQSDPGQLGARGHGCMFFGCIPAALAKRDCRDRVRNKFNPSGRKVSIQAQELFPSDLEEG